LGGVDALRREEVSHRVQPHDLVLAAGWRVVLDRDAHHPHLVDQGVAVGLGLDDAGIRPMVLVEADRLLLELRELNTVTPTIEDDQRELVIVVR
jgi:hypothetical protein